ncbi:hypothetical protein AOLI_G00234090 [Acnodon oligacanthus]
MYSNTEDDFTVLIRELNPQDSAVYRFGVGNEKHKDTELTVQSDSCCGGIKRINAYLGETATFNCNYPDELKTNNKYLTNLNDQNDVKGIISTGKESQKEQKGRFSIFDDRSSKVFSVNISDVTEGDGGVYLCGVWRKETSVGYYSYFREIQLQGDGVYENVPHGKQYGISMGPVSQSLNPYPDMSELIYEELDPNTNRSDSDYENMVDNANQSNFIYGNLNINSSG